MLHLAPQRDRATPPDPASVSDQPFLFPSLATPGPAVGSVSASLGDLLDYEVQLCGVLGHDVTSAAAFKTAPQAFFLCAYIVDREAQLDDMDLDHPERADGYSDVYSTHGSWRSGPYLYVPRDPAGYLTTATLHLEVNGEVRQDARVAGMKWPINEIANQTLLVGTAQRWKLDGEPIGLLTERRLPAHLTFLTGTPAGVALEPPSDDFIGHARRQYFLDGGILGGMTIDAYTKARYSQQLRQDARYLERATPSTPAVACSARFASPSTSTRWCRL